MAYDAGNSELEQDFEVAEGCIGDGCQLVWEDGAREDYVRGAEGSEGS